MATAARTSCVRSLDAKRKTPGITYAPRRSAPDDPREIQGPRDRAEFRNAGNHGKHDQTENVVDDRGTEDDAGLGTGHRVEVLQHSCGDADARRAQSRTDEEVKREGRFGQQPKTDSVSEQHRCDHPDDRDQPGRWRDRAHLGERRFEADLEEKENDTKLREELDRDQLGRSMEGIDAEEIQIAQQDADAQLAEDRGLIQAHRDLAAQLRGKDHRCKDQPDVITESVSFAAGQGRGRNRREQGKEERKASRSAAHRAGP